MSKIVFLDSDTLPHPIEKPEWVTDWRDLPATPQETEAVVQALEQATICITNKIRITPAILARCPQLKYICVAATGFDCIDLQACREHGITVSNVPGYSRQSVAESVIASIFALRRNLIRYQALGKSSWSDSSHFCIHDRPILDVRGAVLGIFGYGAIGAEVARLAKGLGLEVMLAEHRGKTDVRDGYTRFETVIASADILTLHCPLTPSTQSMISQAEIAHMKPGALLINTARGPLVNEDAVIDGLESGALGGAALDVLITEPPTGKEALLKVDHPNLIITPHVAWAAKDGLSRLAAGIAANLNAYHSGQPINVVS
ncbi:MAG: D-2-hydroxyacid dehydrogenase [Orrella sp.]